MKRVCYSICIMLAALAGCTHGDPVEPGGDDLVAVELVAAGNSVQVSRAAAIDAIDNAVIVVFNAAGTDVVMRRYISNYTDGGRVYLRRGVDYKVFAVANLTDDNCPDGSVAEYFENVNTPADLNSLYLLASGAERSNLIMCSDLEDVSVADPLPDPAKIQINMRRVQSKIDLKIYNKISGSGGGVTSGVELHSYYTNNLPAGTSLKELSADRTSEGYWATGSTLFSALSAPEDIPVTENSVTTWYRRYITEIITFENRRGSVDISLIESAYDRKSEAPENALEIGIIGYAYDNNGIRRVLNTYVIPGQGRSAEPNFPDIDDLTNYDVVRNCIYHINVYINGANPASIAIDSRREYLETVVCGELEPPKNGTSGAEF